MGDPMRIRASLTGDTVDVKVLVAHEMETGLRKDVAGAIIPAHYITRVTAQCKGKTVLEADWGPSVSKNPVLGFRFKGAAVGDMISISWVDNLQDSRTDEAAIR